MLDSISAGEEYRVDVTYEWLGSPAPDYTVKLYSPLDLTLTDEAGATNQLHTDGQEPSEFVNQWEGGGHEWGVDGDGEDAVEPEPWTPPPPEETGHDVVHISGHNRAEYNGAYVRGNDWDGEPHFAMGNHHFYHLSSGYWQLDNRDQEVVGFGDYYRGGYLSSTAELSELDGNCYGWSTGAEVCIDVQAAAEPETGGDGGGSDGAAFSISGHPDDLYNGDYYVAEDWNGFPHFESEKGAHLYYYDVGSGGYWQLDHRD